VTGAGQQLLALLALRWKMTRDPGVRVGLLAGTAFLLWLIGLAVGSAGSLDPVVRGTAVELAPASFLGFGLLAVVAPLTAGGGAEVVPSNQLVAYPLRPSTAFFGGLLLAPANLVWVVQLVALAAMTGYLTYGGALLPGAVTAGAYVLALTVLGQATAWLIAGLRQTRRGRLAVAAAGATLLVLCVAVVRAGEGGAALDASPTRTVVAGVVAGGEGELTRWALTTAVLLALLGAGLALGTRACSWALRRPGDAGTGRRTAPLRRRSARRTPLGELLAVDRASVWRAPALRRGGLVLAFLPGLVTVGSAAPWTSLVILPGLVAAGAGLLFGVNAFCLDGSGALWLASLPHDPRVALKAKLLVMTETVFATVVLVLVAGSMRSPGQPTAAELAAIGASAVTCTVVVVTVALGLSVRRPHRADLHGPRDAVAPPGALALASLRMAAPAACVGALLSASTVAGSWLLPLVLATPVLLTCGLLLNRSARRHADPQLRSRIVQAVSAG
jgi:hypothetical protein